MRFDFAQLLHGDGRHGARQLFAMDVQAPERANAINLQVLERNVHHGIANVDLPPHTVGVQPTGHLAVPDLGDVKMAQFTQGHVAKLVHKQRVSLFRHGLAFAAIWTGFRVCRCNMHPKT